MWYSADMNKVVKALVIVAVAVFCMGVGAVATLVVTSRLEATKQPQVHIYTPTELLAEANKLRAEKGVAPLTMDERLNASAAWKAQDMAVYGSFGHVKPGETTKNGLVIATTLVKQDCSYVSENINDGNTSHNPFDTISGWPTSKPHYEAIIDAKYDTTGFGAYQKDGKVYYVEHFCDLR